MPDELRWPYTEPHVEVARWKVDLPTGTMKGISKEDAYEIAAETPGAKVYRSTVLQITGGPHAGTEVLGPWREASSLPNMEPGAIVDPGGRWTSC